MPLLVSITLMLIAGTEQSQPGDAGQRHGGGGDRQRGILFSLLGFRSAMDMAGEVRNPQRNVPLAMAVGLGICLLIYLVLQLSFLVSVPPDHSTRAGAAQPHGPWRTAGGAGRRPGAELGGPAAADRCCGVPSATGMAYLGISDA